MQDVNNIIYIPLNTFQYRFWDRSGSMRDELDGVELRLKPDGRQHRSRESGHRGAELPRITTLQDFTVTIPAALLAQQQRTQKIFTYVMVAIAAISLLVGGIGIMNIVLATVLERTREIGVRRSVGARRFDIVRQFLTESVLISVGGGITGDRVRILSGVADCADGGVENHRHDGIGRGRVRGFGGGRRGVRRLSGGESVADQSDRSAPVRVRVS